MEEKKIDINDVTLKGFIEKLRPPQDIEIRKKIDFGYSWVRSVTSVGGGNGS